MLDSIPLPSEGYLRLKDIIGDRKRGKPAIVPVSASTWWDGVRTGRYPKPRKLSDRVTVWDVRDIRALLNAASNP